MHPCFGIGGLLSLLLLAALPIVAVATEANPEADADPFDTLATEPAATEPAATVPDSTPPASTGVASAAAPAADAALRNEADLSAASGMAALTDATTDQQQAIAAALAFSHALKLYQRLGDGDRVTEMQAQLFWCRKNMGVDALAALASQGGAAADRPDNAATDARVAAFVISGSVPEDQAQDYFDRALDFRRNHPDEHDLNATRFSAVVACFSAAKSAAARAVVAKAATIASQERALSGPSAAQDPTPPVIAATIPSAPDGNSAPSVDAAPTDAKAPAPPLAPGGPTPDSKARWGDRLYARVREAIAKNRPPFFTSSVIHDDLEIDAADPDGKVTLRSGDASMVWAWKRIPDCDRVSLALGLVRDAVPGDHCIAAFYLFLAGKDNEANQQLLTVGAPGDEVRAAFGFGPR